MKDRHRLEQGVRGEKLALGQCRGEYGRSWKLLEKEGIELVS